MLKHAPVHLPSTRTSITRCLLTRSSRAIRFGPSPSNRHCTIFRSIPRLFVSLRTAFPLNWRPFTNPGFYAVYAVPDSWDLTPSKRCHLRGIRSPKTVPFKWDRHLFSRCYLRGIHSLFSVLFRWDATTVARAQPGIVMIFRSSRRNVRRTRQACPALFASLPHDSCFC